MNSVEKSNKNSRENNVKIPKKKGKNRKLNQSQSQTNKQINKKILDDNDIDDNGANNDEIIIKSLNGNFDDKLQINENGSSKKQILLNGSSSTNIVNDGILINNPKNELNGSENDKSINFNITSKSSSKKSKRKSINNDNDDDNKITDPTTIATNNGDNKSDINSEMVITCNDNRSNIKSFNSNLSKSINCQKTDDNIHHNDDNCSNNMNFNKQIVNISKNIEPNSSAQLSLISSTSLPPPQLSSSTTLLTSTSDEITEKILDLSNVVIEYKEYESELQMQDIMRLIQAELSEPYSIYTYRYFIYNWPKLCFLAAHGNEYVGAIVCKLDMHMHVVKRGYIAMLAVKKEYRKLKIGTNLVQKAIEAMLADDADEVVLETEMKNLPALRLYENLGFVRDKRLFRYYLNGVDALRLKLWFR